MKSKLLFLFLIPTQILFAQTFTEKTGTPFEGVRAASVAFSDVNGDGYDDVLVTGPLLRFCSTTIPGQKVTSS